jgi:hypothetical protein
MDPRVHGKNLALSRHECRDQLAVATGEEMTAAAKNGR